MTTVTDCRRFNIWYRIGTKIEKQTYSSELDIPKVIFNLGYIKDGVILTWISYVRNEELVSPPNTFVKRIYTRNTIVSSDSNYEELKLMISEESEKCKVK